MASSLRRLSPNPGEFLPAPMTFFLYSKIPSKSLVTQFLRRRLCTGTPETLPAGSPESSGSDTLEALNIAPDIDLEKSMALRAAFSEARRIKLERIADEVMALDKTEYKDYSAILRHRLCRGEKSLFDVKIEKFEPGAKLDVIRAMLDFADDLDLQVINDLLEGAPSVVKKGVLKEEAERIVEKLNEAGATAVVE